MRLNLASLDHTICAKKRQGWNSETQRARGFEIDNERKSRRLLDRDIAGLGSLQNLVSARQ